MVEHNKFSDISQRTACPHCDLLVALSTPPKGSSLLCPRCGTLLQKRCPNSPLKVLALSITGLLLFLPSIALPLLRFDAFGFTDSANLIETVVHLAQQGYYIVATMTALFAAIIPCIVLLLYCFVSFHLYYGRASSWTARCYRLALHLGEWAMLEVYLLGILIAIIKMMPIASIVYLSGFFLYIALVLSLVLITVSMDTFFFWNAIEELYAANRQGNYIQQNWLRKKTAKENALLLCHTCHKLLPENTENSYCPRCGSRLHSRKPRSISRTWALVITAALLLFPANLLPIMEVDFFGVASPSTILDGIIYFFKTQSYFVGMVIFTASIAVPIFKVAGLTILLFGSHCSTSQNVLRRKTELYRCIMFIGRWSMLDIFVIALLAAMVDFGFISATFAAPACRWFALAVAVTMFAANCFDPRIMWDSLHAE